jgi:hypothetical protein
MLDENLRVLSRRINDMEIELTDKKEKLKNMERANLEAQAQLDCIYDEQAVSKLQLEKQMRQTIDGKEEQLRRMREEKQQILHKAEAELEMLKTQNKHELELIQDKVQAALVKKKEIIDALHEELRLKDM